MGDARQDSPTTAGLISVVIPCHDGERYVAETLRSVLAQDHRPLEVIVVDDGSTDRSAQAVLAFGDVVRLARQPHRGAAAARNRGVELATGELIAFLDADDLWTAHAVPRMRAALAEHPDAGMVVGHMEQFASPELSDEARGHIQGHLDGCMDCLQAFDFQAELKAAIRRKCSSDELPPGLIGRIEQCFQEDFDGDGIVGVSDVAFLDGQLYATVDGGGTVHGNPEQPAGLGGAERPGPGPAEHRAIRCRADRVLLHRAKPGQPVAPDLAELRLEASANPFELRIMDHLIASMPLVRVTSSVTACSASVR